MNFWDKGLNTSFGGFSAGKLSSGAKKSESLFSGSNTSKITSMFGNSTVGSLGKVGVGFASGDVGSIVSGSLGFLSKIFGGSGVSRDRRLAQQSLDQAKRDSGFSENASVTVYNRYLKQLYKWYTYQGQVKGRVTGAKMINDTIQRVESYLKSKGLTSTQKTYTEQRLKGNYNVNYTQFGGSVSYGQPDGFKESVSFTPFKNIQKAGIPSYLIYIVGGYFLLKLIKK